MSLAVDENVVRLDVAVNDAVAVRVGEPLADLATSLDPAALAPVDGAIPIEPFEKAVPIVQTASSRIGELVTEVGEIDASSTIGPVADARTRVADLLDTAAPALREALSGWFGTPLKTTVPIIDRPS